VAQLLPYGDTFINQLSSQMPTGLSDLVFFARITLSFGVGFLLVGRDRLSGLLVAPPALMLWLWLQTDAIRSAIALPLLIGAGIATALGAAFTLRTGEKRAGIRLAILVALVTRLPFTYAGLYHHDFAPPPTALQALVAVLRDLLIAAALVTGPLWSWALWMRIRHLIAHDLGAQEDGDKKRVNPQSLLFTVWETLRRWWFIGAIPVVAVALITGAHPGDWLDVALDASGCLGVIEQHDSPVQSVAFSPAGDLLASGSKDGTARIWRIDDGRKFDRTLLQRLKIPTGGREAGYSHDVDFSPDGETLAFGLPDGTVRLWRVKDGTLLHTLRGHTSKVCSLAFSPEEAILASGSWDGAIRLWRATDGTTLRALNEHKDAVLALDFSPDGSLLASGSFDGMVNVWRISDGTLLQTLGGPGSAIEGLTFSPDGAMLASGVRDGTVQLWKVGDWHLLQKMTSEWPGINSIAFSPDGTMLATGDSWYRLQWWRVADGVLLRDVVGHEDTVESVAFSPDGKILASGSLDGTVKLWQVP
jgi:sugar lactone lactonase YvrE